MFWKKGKRDTKQTDIPSLDPFTGQNPPITDIQNEYYPPLKPANLAIESEIPVASDDIPKPPILSDEQKRILPDFEMSSTPMLQNSMDRDMNHTYYDPELSELHSAVDNISAKYSAKRLAKPNTGMTVPTPPENLKSAINTKKIRYLEDEYLKIKPWAEDLTVEEVNIDEKALKKSHSYLLIEDYRLIISELHTINKELSHFDDLITGYEGLLSRHKNVTKTIEENFESLQRNFILIDSALFSNPEGK